MCMKCPCPDDDWRKHNHMEWLERHRRLRAEDTMRARPSTFCRNNKTNPIPWGTRLNGHIDRYAWIRLTCMTYYFGEEGGASAPLPYVLIFRHYHMGMVASNYPLSGRLNRSKLLRIRLFTRILASMSSWLWKSPCR